jgi:hypothetical protein
MNLLTALFLGFRSETLVIALTTFHSLPRIDCIALHADFLANNRASASGKRAIRAP